MDGRSTDDDDLRVQALWRWRAAHAADQEVAEARLARVGQ
jgi:hypothetical protein